jgi:hypothetical protein
MFLASIHPKINDPAKSRFSMEYRHSFSEVLLVTDSVKNDVPALIRAEITQGSPDSAKV